jgi:hypothetical protein
MNKETIKSMGRFNHSVIAEESIAKYIKMLEEDAGEQVPIEDQQWLYEKGFEIFNKYYMDEALAINVVSPEDKNTLDLYLEKIMDRMSRMYAHILVTEFKLYLISGRSEE